MHAELKKFPKSVMLEFQFSAALYVSSKQAKHAIRLRFHSRKDFGDAGQNLSIRGRKHFGEESDVLVEKRADIFYRRIDMVLLQNAGSDSRIGPACDLDVMQIVVRSIALFDDELECPHTRTAGADERAINVE